MLLRSNGNTKRGGNNSVNDEFTEYSIRKYYQNVRSQKTMNKKAVRREKCIESALYFFRPFVYALPKKREKGAEEEAEKSKVYISGSRLLWSL